MNNQFKFVVPKTKLDLQRYFFVRWSILRKPWGQKMGTEVDEFEDEAYHIMGIDSKERVLAVGRIHNISSNIAQIRYMAVLEKYTKLGFGTKVLKLLENYAIDNKISKIVLNSRESAIDFYIKNGYKKIKQVDKLFDEINHWFMEKEIN
jgi:ribosomal protein S18 acetylase RimI-like enzyme